MEDLITKIAVAVGGIGAGAYGMYQKIKTDNRNSRSAEVTDAAWHQVIVTLREEVSRLSDRLAAVEEQNHRCEESNATLREELIALKKQLQLI